MAATKPKLGDVQWITVTMLPVTTCEPPEGAGCWLARTGQTGWSTSDAKRHALENPGHVVTRDAVTRTRCYMEPPEVTA